LTLSKNKDILLIKTYLFAVSFEAVKVRKMQYLDILKEV